MMTFYQILILFASAMRLSSVSIDKCSVYEEFERDVPCGSNGYTLYYGLKNCRIFSTPEVVARFTIAGQRFLNCAKDCVIGHLQKLFKNSRPTCDLIYSSAVDSHVPCYRQCGFCQICRTEKLTLLSSFDLMDFLSFKLIKTAYRILKNCGLISCLNPF